MPVRPDSALEVGTVNSEDNSWTSRRVTSSTRRERLKVPTDMLGQPPAPSIKMRPGDFRTLVESSKAGSLDKPMMLSLSAINGKI
jgi:hypothetical protein